MDSREKNTVVLNDSLQYLTDAQLVDICSRVEYYRSSNNTREKYEAKLEKEKTRVRTHTTSMVVKNGRVVQKETVKSTPLSRILSKM